MLNEIKLFGIKFHPAKKEEIAEIVKEFINGNGAHQISFPNAYSVVIAQRNKKFKNAINSSSLVLADGMPIIWVSRLFRASLPGRITGYDFFIELCKIASKERLKFFFMGSTVEVLEKMCHNLKMKFPYLKIVGSLSPPFRKKFKEAENEEMTNKINSAKPDILVVGMTAPKQEIWIYENLSKLNVKIAIGIGAVFEFIAKTKKRAPRWVQKIGMEWFFRLIQEPKRLWKRYLVGNTIFIFLVFKMLFKKILKFILHNFYEKKNQE